MTTALVGGFTTGSARRRPLVARSEASSIDWRTVPRYLPDGTAVLESLCDAARMDPLLGEQTNCVQFCYEILQMLECPEMPRSKALFDREAVAAILDGMHSREVYVLLCDQIGHALVVQTRGGRAIIAQAHVIARFKGDHPGKAVGRGYRGVDWLTPAPQPKWTTRMKEVHAAYGGGRELERDEVEDEIMRLARVLEALVRLQEELIPQLVDVLQEQIFAQQPPEFRQWEEAWVRSNLDVLPAGKPIGSGAVATLSPLQELGTVAAVKLDETHVRYTRLKSGGYRVELRDGWATGVKLPPVTWEVPAALQAALDDAYSTVSGSLFQGRAHTAALRFAHWRHQSEATSVGWMDDELPEELAKNPSGWLMIRASEVAPYF